MNFDFTLEQIILVNSTVLTLSSTGALALPSGTTAQEPASPVNGWIRYNTTISAFEGYVAGVWRPFTTGSSSLRLYEENPSAETTPLTAGTNAVAIGTGASASGTSSVAIGENADASNTNAMAFGGETTASGTNSYAIGQDAIASATDSYAIGHIASATASEAMALGNRSVSRLTGGVVMAAGRFGTSGDAQKGFYLLRNSTTNATLTELFLDGSAARLTLVNNSVFTFNIYVSARRTDATGGGAGYKFEGVIKKDTTAASTTLVGAVSKTVLGETDAAWDVTVDANTTNGALRVQVTGEAAKTIRWVASVETTEVTN